MVVSAAESDATRELRAALGEGQVDSSREHIVRMLKDNSWFSPLLLEEIERRSREEGPFMGVSAVVVPRTAEDVARAAGIAARHRIAITPRGSGTSAFGNLTPERGGLIFDMRGLSGECRLEGEGIRAPAGVMQGAVERAARASGRELPVLTTTYATATVGGWVTGGHVGLGSGVHGAVWDGIVREVRLVTVDEDPVEITLTGEDVAPVLHTFGTAGLVTEVVLSTVEAREWVEALAFFPTFELASRFVWVVSHDDRYHHRALTAQEEALMPAFRRPLGELAESGAGVMMIVDETELADIRSVAEALSGRFVEWQRWELKGGERPSIAAMVYGHRLLWIKQLLPEAAFLHVYFDPDDPDGGARLLKDRFGDEVLLETKFIRSKWLLGSLGYAPEGTLPASVITIVDGDRPGKVAEVMTYCDEAGIQYQNPHTGVVEDNGLFRDVSRIVELKSRTDPYNLVNTGKLRSARTRGTLRGLDHVALGVPDFDASVDLFVKRFGLEVLLTGNVPATGQRMAMLRDAEGGKLELVETPDEDSVSVLHVAFWTDDADEAHHVLVGQGWQTKREPHDLPRNNSRTALLTGQGFDLQVISYRGNAAAAGSGRE